MTINELHHAFLHRRSTLTSVLDRLEAKALVTRTPGSADRRNVGVTLTPRGRRVAKTIARALAELNERLAPSALGPGDVAAVRAVADAASREAEPG
jgi:DNA-binding MarR family transcriptional regulator